MTPDNWDRAKELFEAALELDPSRRPSFLAENCRDQALRLRIEELLNNYREAGNFLDDPIANAGIPAARTPAGIRSAEALHSQFQDVLDAATSAGAEDPMLGRQFGAYKLVRRVGQGGMAVVFLASRSDDEYRKLVAVKLVQPGLDSRDLLSRFRNERQTLAGLDHPNIVKLLDGGTTSEGWPFLVMDYVEGSPIDQYCDQHKLSVDDRLHLFAKVCDAVQYAHQKLVIHRDLKPSNILVVADDTPKLLDFGIAKVLTPESSSENSVATQTGTRCMTPAYASPEQVRGEPIATASDVYSLGVVLYELLTGYSPYHVTSHLPHEMERAVCEVAPEAPSLALRRTAIHGQQGTGQQGKNQLHPDAALDGSLRKRSRRLRGDLDNIVQMALRKEPQRRYTSVEQFAGDIRRHLEHLPIIASKATIRYRTSKFVTRHKAAVVAASLITLTLLAGLAITIREARIAERRFNDVRQLANSLIFDVHDSIKDLPGSTPARKLIVDRALQYLNQLAQESRGDPSLQRELATAYERVGLVQGHYMQNNLGDTKGSLDSYQKALAIRKQVAARSTDRSDRLAVAESSRLVANQQWALGAYADALKNINAAIAASEGLNNAYPNDPKILSELGLEYKRAGVIYDKSYAGGIGDQAKAADFYGKAVTTDEVLLAFNPDVPDIQHAYANDLNALAGAFEDQDLNAALGYYRRELEIERSLHQRSADLGYARGVTRAYNHIAQMYDRLGDPRRVVENYMQVLRLSIELVSVDPKNVYFQQSVAAAYSNTAHALSETSRDPRSLDYMEKGLTTMRKVVASSPENTEQQGILAALLATNGSTLMNLGKPEAALKQFDEARSIFKFLRRNVPIDADVFIMTCTEKMGEAAARNGKFTLAAGYFNEVLQLIEPALRAQNANPSLPYLAADSYSGLGDLQLQKARDSTQTTAKRREGWTEARSWYLRSLDAWRLIPHPRHTSPSDFDVGDPAQIERKLQLCEKALAKVG